jgi:tRNA A37 threonylcarbamoyladenosine modification protein TsaB
VPLVAISSLHTQALAFIEQKSNNHQYIASTMQARGKKIYLGIYSYEGREMLFPETFILSDENIHSLKEKYKDIIFIGSGYSDIVSEDNIIYPSSRYMIKETFSKYQNNEFVSTVYFEPMYI